MATMALDLARLEGAVGVREGARCRRTVVLSVRGEGSVGDVREGMVPLGLMAM